jgi:hypothetical protein
MVDTFTPATNAISLVWCFIMMCSIQKNRITLEIIILKCKNNDSNQSEQINIFTDLVFSLRNHKSCHNECSVTRSDKEVHLMMAL